MRNATQLFHNGKIYLIKAIRSANTKCHCVKLCKQVINRLSVGNTANIICIPSHVGIEENEKAGEPTLSGQLGEQFP